MERSEPTLVPGWLKNSTSSTGGSTLSHADDLAASRVTRTKPIAVSNGHNPGRPSGFEKTSSAYFWRGSNGNSSGKFRSYSDSGRNQRDRERDKDAYGSREQAKLFLEDHQHRDLLEPEGSSLFSRFERDGLRRTQSIIPGKHGDTLPRKVVTDLSVVGKNTEVSSFSKVSLHSGANKTNFERDFPFLGTGERAALPDVGRVPSPGLTTAIQSLQISASKSAGEKWTSALAEVPVLAASNGSALSSASEMASPGSPSVGLGANAGFNMAEALTHGPVGAQTPPQLTVGAQRREELAIKQSRQLIPVTPSMPKSLALSLSDKQKGKLGQASPSVISSAPAKNTPRSVPGNVDALKSSNSGNFHVLKPAREKNGVTIGMKDNLSPTSGTKVGSSVFSAREKNDVTIGMKDNLSPTSGTKVGSSVFSAPPSAAVRNPTNNGDRKPMAAVPDKRATSQAQSRNEFFNLVRKKSMANSSPTSYSDVSNPSVVENRGNANSPSFSDRHSEMNVLPATHTDTAEGQHADVIPTGKPVLTCNGDTCKEHPCSDPFIKDEEEAAFLRSLGWEESNEEDGLTEEEISSFRMDLTKYIESNPSPRILQGMQLTCLLPFNSHKGNGISSGLNPSGANPET